jgi:cyclohexadienyl dehydratase
MSPEYDRDRLRGVQVSVRSSLFRFRVEPDQIRIIYAIMFSFFLALLGCHSAGVRAPSPATGPAATPSRPILRVATSGDYSPFSHWPTDSAVPVGFSVSVAQAYAEQTGSAVEWVRFRWPELAANLADGSFDLALSGITVRPDRSMLGRFGLPLTTSGAVVLVGADSSLDSVLDLDRPSIHIAVNAGGHLERVTRRLFPSAHIEAIADNTAVLGRLDGGKVHAVVTDTLEAPHWQKNAQTRLRVIGPLTRDQKAAWFPPENEEEARRFNRWLLREESSGRLDRLRQEYGLPAGRTALALPALLSSLDERLTLMPAVADAKHILGTAVENSTREEVVLDAAVRAIRDAADEAGATPPDQSAVRRFFRAQIEAAKWIQIRRLRDRPARPETAGPAERLNARTTLDEVIRPALIYLGNRISMLVVASLAESPKDLSYDDVAHSLERHNLPEPYLRAIYQALSDIIQREKNTERSHRPSPARTDTAPSG